MEVFSISKLRNLYTSGKKAFIKTRNKIFHCFPFTTSSCKRKCETNGKSCSGAKVGKIKSFERSLKWKHNCIHRLITRYDVIINPCIYVEFIVEHGLSLFL